MFRALIVACAAFCFAQPAFALGQDKVLHFSLSVVMAGSACTALYKTTDLPPAARMAGAFGTSMLVGFAKELTDERTDGGDLVADAAGSLVGVLVSEYVSRRLWAQLDEDKVVVGIKGGF
jgi:uncharacterized protein YfiM (DUF2279 family)